MASSSIQALLSQFDPWPAWETIHQAKLEQQNMAEAAKQDSEKAAEIQVQLKKAQHEIYRMIEVWKWNTSAQIYALQFVANVLSGSDPGMCSQPSEKRPNLTITPSRICRGR
jgi:U3 small nucleolar RNA-associated protein 14